MSYVRRSRHDRGAAAVEFALVVPILLMIVFGITDFGLWFSDSLNLRQGVREGARQGVVDDLTPATGCSGTAELARVACNTKDRVAAYGGLMYARVALLNPDGTSSTAWKKGQQLLVCSMVKENGLTGITPLPKDGIVRASVRMRIETGTHTYTTNVHADTPTAGANWSWCVP